MLISLEGSGPLFQRIYEGLRGAILEGRLEGGARLPSSRALASELGVSRTTILLAFDQLLAEGYVTGRVGSGTYVARELPDAALRAAGDGGGARTAAAATRLSEYGERIETEIVIPPPRAGGVRYDFRYGLPPVEEFPHDAWRRILARRLRLASLRSLQYGPAEGYGPLREAIAGYLARSRAVTCTPEQVLVVNGSQQALDLVTRVLVDPGDAVVVEEPQYQGARKIFQAAGATVVPVEVDAEGLDASRIPDAGHRMRLAYVTPSHQFPSGAVMTLPRRLALLAWAEAQGAFVLEDDYDSEYRYCGRPLESLQGLDRAGRVIYTGTFSKVMFPSLRVGYIVPPEPLVETFAKAKWLADRQTSTLEQEALAEFISGGHFERHLRRSRTRNASRRAALLDALAEQFGDRVEVQGANAGIHVIAWLGDVPRSAVDDLVDRARAEGVGIYSVAPYYIDPPERAGLLLGYASLSERDIREGVARLARIMLRISGPSGSSS
jgi:GntR family transcriptional regulator/MocR family aminotransferase